MLTKYLGRSYEYKKFDCILLCKDFYFNELGIEIIIPEYPEFIAWRRFLTTKKFDEFVKNQCKKVNLTDAKNYDLIVFKDKKDYVSHFGIYLMPNKILHIEENSYSRIDLLDDTRLSNFFGVYRHNEMV